MKGANLGTQIQRHSIHWFGLNVKRDKIDAWTTNFKTEGKWTIKLTQRQQYTTLN